MLSFFDIMSLGGGELSPQMFGRTDHEKYYSGAESIFNMVVRPQGGVTRRPGTLYVAGSKVPTQPARLRRFIFNTVQAYMIEFGLGYARFYMNTGQILNGGVPVEISTPYVNASDLALLSFTQSNDTLYVYHPTIPTQKLTRSSHVKWGITPIQWKDGPYLPVNTGAVALTPSAASGNGITITAAPNAKAITGAANNGSGVIRIKCVAHGFADNDPVMIAGVGGTVEANGAWRVTLVDVDYFDLQNSAFVNAYTAGGTASANVFAATDVGRLVRIQHGSTWGYAKITAFTNSYTVTADVKSNFGSTTAQTAWRLGKWSGTTGYAYTGTFNQQRLTMGGHDYSPSNIAASVIGDFENMAPTATDGTVSDRNALDFTISDDQVNPVRWLSSAGNAQAAQLGIGTAAAEQILQQQTATQALSPTNLQAYRETNIGSIAGVEPQRIGKQVLFANQNGRKIHAWTFDWTANGYLAPDITELADHITDTGVRWMAYQKNPWSINWAGLNDGSLIGVTYRGDQKVIAWHHHQLGGNYYGGPPLVESGDVIPAPDGSYDQVWLLVARTINGQVVRTIEVMSRPFDRLQQEEAHFVDCAATRTLTAPNATMTPGTADGHKTPIAGDTVTIATDADVFLPGSVGSVIRASRGKALITAYTDARHVQALVVKSMRNCAPQAAGAWTCTAPINTLTLAHLPGETIEVFGDGADYGQSVADGAGQVQVDPGVTYAIAGLPYVGEIVFMPFEPGHALMAASNGKVKRIDTMWLRFFETGGCRYGMKGGPLDDLETRSAADLMGQPPPLISRPERVKPAGSSDEDWQMMLQTVGPMPLSLLALSARADVGEIGNG